MKNKSIILVGIIILIGLFTILFVLPDSFFTKKEAINEITTKNSDEFPFRNLSDMWKNLNNNIYSYKYQVFIGDKEYIYDGAKNKDEDTGIFSSSTYIEEYKGINDKINHDLINPSYIQEKVKNIEPKKFNYDDYRTFTYNVKIDDTDTEIIIYTDLKNITKIVISNMYYQYNLNYTNIVNN